MRAEALSSLAGLLGHRLGDGAVRAYETGARKAGAELGLAPEEAIGRALANDRRAYEALLAAVTVPETYVFRNPEHFAVASRHARAALVAGRPVRSAWSVGCATGEEAYSLAVALLPHSAELKVVGSDISPRALQHARRGVYGGWSFRQLAPASLGWEQTAEGWRVPERVRSVVTFQEANLAARTVTAPPELGPTVDVIFCRNVLLYFAPEPAARLLRTLVDSLSEGGLLVLGALEVPALLPPGLERMTEADGCAFLRRRSAPAPAKNVVRQSVVSPPAPAPTRLVDASRLSGAGQLHAALGALAGGTTPSEWELAASVCIELGDAAKARGYLQRVVASEPDRASAHLRLALLASREGDSDGLESARASLERLTAGKAADVELDGEGLRVGYVRAALAELPGAAETRGTGT